MIYRCVNKCIWEGKLRREGFLTPHLASLPNHHFVPNDEETIDEEPVNEENPVKCEDEPVKKEEQEFTEEELLSKKYNTLKKIAINKGLDISGVSNVSDMVTLIMGA